ncbi:hypothetical protein IEO21_07392 [Rhodonia placenta]|uniref:Uncharacterized protein n=1 Tax=Rhodonia placenta TaxID=104341 RepID=A0A8H7NYH5_9APHY|nr:hypothetical protein IEO21_07392 [Postia placenta]
MFGVLSLKYTGGFRLFLYVFHMRSLKTMSTMASFSPKARWSCRMCGICCMTRPSTPARAHSNPSDMAGWTAR